MSTSLKNITLGMLLPLAVLAGPSKKLSMSANPPAYSMTSTVAKYYQYQLHEGKEAEQLSELTFTPVYQNKKLKFTSIIVYSANDKDSTQNDLEDPLFNLSSNPKNISAYLKGKYFLTGSLGVSKNSREVKGQYGALGSGYGLSLDSSALRAPGVAVSSSLSFVKAFQRSELNSKDESNVNLYSVSNSIFGYSWKKLSASVQFMFVNSLKYDEDISNIYLTSQELSYSFTKTFATVVGHSNKAKTMDEETGDFNIRVLNNETSYFYLRMDISI
jgi:hypothetical protein